MQIVPCLRALVGILSCLHVASALTLCAGGLPVAAPSSLRIIPPPYRTDRILVQPKADIAPVALVELHRQLGVEVLQTFKGIGDLQVLHLSGDKTVPELIGSYEESGLVEFAEPDYTIRAFATPNDPKFADGTLWGLHNTGQNGGTEDADIDAPEAWEVLTSAAEIVVAVVDTGVRHTHEDLAANMWVNPSDGTHGTNALAGTTDTSDDSGHGTLVAGILGAVGNNEIGVTGVAWEVQIMACKAFNNFGVGNLSSAIAGMEFARMNGADIINASWGFETNSLALSNAVLSARNAGIIVVAAAGNSGTDLDATPVYPASYDLDNVLSVAYTTRNDALGADSNYGATHVDLAAPGEQIHSTFGATDSFYFTITGSSFAAPFVTGACALVWTLHPEETHQQIIARILNGTDPLPALAGKCVTGGRLNLHQALVPPLRLAAIQAAADEPFRVRVSAEPNLTFVFEVSTDLTEWVPVFTNSTSMDGTFEFSEEPSTTAPRRFYRAMAP
ncbi:MAG TPA: S8 family peptidase [Methylomirabilota bacterium]|nr:S8 family peptidase [Methylomirabilota bacterium]